MGRFWPGAISRIDYPAKGAENSGGCDGKAGPPAAGAVDEGEGVLTERNEHANASLKVLGRLRDIITSDSYPPAFGVIGVELNFGSPRRGGGRLESLDACCDFVR